MKNRILISMLACLLTMTAWSQTRQVTGRVTSDSTKGNLAGISVTLKGAGISTATDNEGRYTIQVPQKGGVLVFSSVGYNSTEVALGNKSVVDVALSSSASTLDVVIIGYQAVRRKDLTSAVSSVGAKQLKDIPINSAAEALQGKLAGVQVAVSEGAPGADVDVYVRGRNSITQSGSPLYIVDGVQVENALSVLSPQDIESIDVLKDAASTAIYGARGSNGVFIITTKGGKNTGGKTTVTYNAFVGTSKLSKKLDMMDPYNFVLYQYERAKFTENATDTATVAQYIRNMSNYDTIAKAYTNPANAIDWQDKMLGRNAFQMTHNIGVSGGTAATQYNLSATYNKQEGLISNSDYTRKLASFRFDHKASDKLKVGFNVRYNEQETNGAGTSDNGGAGSNRLRQYTRYRPIILPGQSEDTYDADLDARNPGNGLNLLNPIQLLNNEYRNRKQTAYNLNGYAQFSLARNVQFKSTFGYDVNNQETRLYDDTLTGNSRSWSRMPVLGLGTSIRRTINNSNVITYSNPSLFKTKHALDILVGHEIYETNTKLFAQEVRYFPVGTKPDVAFANLGLASAPAGFTQPRPSSSEVEQKQLSFFSRISYNYNKKYLLTLNFRADGSSLFGPNYNSAIPLTDSTNRKWGYFPSASVAWRIYNEDFMKGLSFISDAKVRLSYGTSGNNRIAAYGYTTGFAPPANGGYGLMDALSYTLGFSSTRLGNPIIKWESLTSKNLGFDLSFFKNRLNLTVDLYSNTTKDLLIDNPIDPTSGFLTQYQNVGTTRNNGLEIQLNGIVMNKKDFNWNANFNISFNKNKIISLGRQQLFTANSGWFSSTANPNDFLVKVNEEVGTMYGLKVLGYYKTSDFTTTPYSNPLYPNLTYQYTLSSKLPDPAAVLADRVQPGQVMYEDFNNDGKITLDGDRQVIGHALPKFTGGFNQQFTFKGFDAAIFMNFSYGNDILNANKLEFATAYGVDNNMLAIMNDRWKVIDEKGNLVQKQIGATIVAGVSPAELDRINANARIWSPARTTTGFYPNSFAVEDGSYLRINNITLGYTLPARLLSKAKITSFRVYATAYNVATITGYSGYDPDVNARRGSALTPGVDYAAYPRGRTFVAGLNVSF